MLTFLIAQQELDYCVVVVREPLFAGSICTFQLFDTWMLRSLPNAAFADRAER
jgi:hypothetical protein